MNITKEFGIFKKYLHAERILSGHINDTYKITYSDSEAYILQKVNGLVFRSPEKIMSNIRLLNGAMGDIVPRYLLSQGKNYTVYDGALWRMCPFFTGTVSYDVFENNTLCAGFGEILGKFHKAAEKINPADIQETIPDFHNTEKIINRLPEEERRGILTRAAEYSKTLYAKKNLRTVHNDAKCSNVLFYADTLRPAALLDLDTVMTGLAVYDMGDAVRSSCVSGNKIDEDRFLRFLSGYSAGFGKPDTEGCVYGAVCLSAELAARYLYDVISGENYFRFKTRRGKLESWRRLTELAENTEADAERLISKGECI